jgi:S1-C subfamily serine protease
MRALSMIVAAMIVYYGSDLKSDAQENVPAELAYRTSLIRTPYDKEHGGTAFSVDYKGKLYLVTARHVVNGIDEHDATLQLRRVDKWEDYHTVKTIYPSSPDVDIAVFSTNETVSQPFSVGLSGTTVGIGITFGQVVWFVGYPFGLASVGAKGSTVTPENAIPFFKRGSMSAVDASNPNAVLYYIDGFNNPGFSGGPVVYYEFASHQYKILGVVQGFRLQASEISVNGKLVDTPILVNSGILVCYSIQHAVDAIEKSLSGTP